MSTYSTPYLDQTELEKRATEALKGLMPRQKRMLSLLVGAGQCSTGFVASKCQIGNVSAAVISMQQHLRQHGLFIRNYRQPGLTNKFGEPSRAHIWSLSGYTEVK